VTTPTTAPAPARTLPHPSDLRLLGPWYLAVFLNSYAVTLLCAGCYDFADVALNASAPTRLWMSAAWGLAYIFISLAAGKTVEKLSARKTLLAALPLSVLAALLGLLIMTVPHSWTWAPWLLIALMLPLNITSTTCWPALESAISRNDSRMKLPSRMATYNISWALAGFAAFFTRGALEEHGWWTIFAVPALVLLLSFLILAFFAITREKNTDPHTEEESTHDTPAMKKRAVTLLHMAWVGNALAYVGINVLTPVQTKLADDANVGHLAANIGMGSLALAGFVTSVWGLTRAAGFLLAGKWTGWHYKARWLVGAQLALAASFLLMLLIPNIWVLIATQILFGLATALIYSSSLYYAMHTSEGSGGHAGFHEALIGLGIFVGPAVGALAGGDARDTAALTRIAWSVTTVLLLGALAMWIMGAGKDRKLVVTEEPK
jgi:MFS family permease